MDTAIWKFPFKTTAGFTLTIPKGAKILSIQTQRDIPCIWALVNPSRVTEERSFVVYGTGHKITYPNSKEFIGTYQGLGGILVFHLFELIT